MASVNRQCEGCGVQFTFTVKCGHRRNFCTKECHSASDQRTAEKRKYQLSDKGKIAIKNYEQSNERKTNKKRYRQSNEYKATYKRYRQSDIGKATFLRLSQGRRARKRDAFVEDVDVRVLLDLQGGACFLCSQPISLDIKWPDPMSLSLDHITPLVRSGSHSYDNCAATHLRCNIVKGVKSVEDVAPLLRLVS